MANFSLSIPAWEQSQLSELAAANELSGVNPVILGAIDQAESSGEGSTVNNPEGYGGFFGLSPTSNYGPNSPLGPVNTEVSVAAFDQQAQVAAEEFASLLNDYGGDALHAEYAYQQGGNAPYPGDAAAAQTEGGSIVNSALGGSTTLQTGATAPVTAAGGTAAPQSIQLNGIGAVLQEIDELMNPTGGGTLEQILTLGGSDVAAKVEGLVVRGLFAIGFLGILYFGVKALTSSSPGGSAIDRAQTQQRLGQGDRRLDIAQQAENRRSGITAGASSALETVGEAAVV